MSALTAPKAPATKKPSQQRPALILELCDRQPSEYILEGTEGTADEQRLDRPSFRRLLPYANAWVPEENDGFGAFVRIRHIKGCPYIREDEQERHNWAGRANLKHDAVFIKEGTLTVVYDGRNGGLYDWLLNHPANESNPNRPEGVRPIFREIRPKEIAKQTLDQFRYERLANNIVDELYDETRDGYSYNEPLIDMISNLYGFQYLDSYEEKVVSIRNQAKADPEGFVNSVGNSRQTYMVEVAEAIKLNVISIVGEQATFSADNRVIVKLRSRKNDAKVDELAKYFLTDEGKADYQQMIMSLTTARDKALGTV